MSEIGAYVKKKREAVGYSLNKLSSLCKISSSELLKIEKGERKNPNCKCLCSIAKALNISSLELLLKAGYIEKSDIPPEPQIKGIEKLSSSDMDEVQLFVDFLIAKRSGALTGGEIDGV